mgnify:FL=1
MPSGYLHRGGPWEVGTRLSTASTAIAVLDALKTTTGKTLPLTAGAKNDGVALALKTSGDTATTAVPYIRAFSGRTKWFAEDKVSNLVATLEGNYADLSGTTGAMGFDSAVTTNKDFYLHKVLLTGTSGNAVIVFSDPAYLNAVN